MKSGEDATNNAVKEAQETVERNTSLEVSAQTGKVEDGRISEYRSNVKVAFLVKENRQSLTKSVRNLFRYIA